MKKFEVKIQHSKQTNYSKNPKYVSDYYPYTMSKFGFGKFDIQSDSFIMINYIKHRKKVRSQKKIKKIFNGVEVITTKRTYDPAYWEMYVYRFPVEILKILNIKVVQKNRNFIIQKLNNF